ncbi:MAG: sigma-70 family RNA polymerase sigma factor [Oscillospiraceae bacterium]|nr:sigma-70 family RNA polymerase sigma factor [Oscillospiraceae bacterium]
MAAYNSEALYREHYPKVYGYIRNHIIMKDDAEDLTQTVFLKVFTKLDTFDPDKSAISTWIFNIMRNTLTDYLRKNSVRAETELTETLASDADDFSDTLILEDELDRLADALERLTSTERDIILLHYYKDYTLLKISEMLGLSYGQAKRLNAKALAKLSDYMNR